MRSRAGSLQVFCVWMVILMQNLNAAHLPKKRLFTGVGCRPKQLTTLTKVLVIESLDSYDEANGKPLPPWAPGFPELYTPDNSSLPGSKVQCSLLFMAQALHEVRKDQQNNLNPNDTFLHEKLKETISTVTRLAVCMKHVLGGDCSPKPAPPKMPQTAFQRKQWGHTLLEKSRDYLAWLEQMVTDQMSMVRVTNKNKNSTNIKPALAEYLEGSGYLL